MAQASAGDVAKARSETRRNSIRASFAFSFVPSRRRGANLLWPKRFAFKNSFSVRISVSSVYSVAPPPAPSVARAPPRSFEGGRSPAQLTPADHLPDGWFSYKSNSSIATGCPCHHPKKASTPHAKVCWWEGRKVCLPAVSIRRSRRLHRAGHQRPGRGWRLHSHRCCRRCRPRRRPRDCGG